jgi:hypothetical protein
MVTSQYEWNILIGMKNKQIINHNHKHCNIYINIHTISNSDQSEVATVLYIKYILWTSVWKGHPNIFIVAPWQQKLNNNVEIHLDSYILSFFYYIQSKFVILNTDISNTMVMSKWYGSPNHLFSKHFSLDISKFFLQSHRVRYNEVWLYMKYLV